MIRKLPSEVCEQLEFFAGPEAVAALQAASRALREQYLTDTIGLINKGRVTVQGICALGQRFPKLRELTLAYFPPEEAQALAQECAYIPNLKLNLLIEKPQGDPIRRLTFVEDLLI